jgi:D-galactarolactone cycloisomerase
MAKIEHVECVNLRFEYEASKRFRYSGGLCTARVTSIIKVHTSDGRVGIGSCYAQPALSYLIVTKHLAPLLVGQEAGEIQRLWELMYGQTLWYGRKGVAMSSLGAIDVALWDLKGKREGQPVWELLNESAGHVTGVPAYASGLLWKEKSEQAAEEAAGYAAKGFKRMKMRMGKSEAYDTAAVRAVRKAVGPKIDVMVDAGMRYHPKLAQRVGRTLKECGVFWFEEPFGPESYGLFRQLKAMGGAGVAIAAGENEFGLDGFEELMSTGGVDIVQADASRAGGITVVNNVAQVAKMRGLKIAPHTWSDAVAVMANAHCVAAAPNGVTVEVDQTGNPFIEKLLVEPLEIKEGVLKMSRKPGLGVELDEAVLKRYTMADPLEMPDGRYSDLTFGREFLTPAGAYEEGEGAGV